MGFRGKTPVVCVALAALVLIAFWPVLHNGFVDYDDQQYVSQNPHVQNGLNWQSLRWAFTTGHASNWHPLTWLSHMLDWEWFGANPAGHHLVNLLFHMANSVLLLLALERMTRALWPSALVAALFALHPLRVESVAWIAERKDVLSGCFFMLTLYSYLRYSEARRASCGSPSPAPGRPAVAAWYLTALAMFALGLLSKPMLVTVPFVLLLLDFWPLDRLKSTNVGRLLLEKGPFLCLALASSVVTLIVQGRAMRAYETLPPGPRVANAVISYARYLGKTLWPADLAVLYPHPTRWPIWAVLGAAVLVVGISILVFRDRKTRPWLLVGWCWFLGMLVPVIGLVQVGAQAMADRYTYLPGIGLALIAVKGGQELLDRWHVPSPSAVVAMALLLGACVLRTGAQIRFWRDTETLFTHAVEATHGNWLAHYKLALLDLDRYQRIYRGDLASQVLEPAAPDTASSTNFARDALLQAVAFHARASLQVAPGFPEAHLTLAKVLMEQHRLDEARQQLNAAIRLNPQSPEVRQDIAEILLRDGQAKEAIKMYEAALELRPDWAAVLNNAAWLMATHPDSAVRNGSEAQRLAERACHLTGYTNLWFLNTLAAACAEKGDFPNAVTAAIQARQLAEATGQKDIVQRAADRLELYKSHQPLRAP